MTFNFKEKVVIVTGGSRGIGRAISHGFAKAGAKIAMVYSSNEAMAQETLQSLPGQGHKSYRINVAQSSLVEETFQKIKEEMGALHHLINNAGVTRDQLLLRMKEEDWDQVLNINLKGVFNCTKAAVKLMLKERQGTVVNITSVIGQTGNAGQSNYAASKAGIIAFTKSVALEVASRNIRLNNIAPGFIKSDMTESLTEEQKKKILDKVPLGQIGNPEEIAAAAMFLSSDHAGYITGETLNVNGGLYMD